MSETRSSAPMTVPSEDLIKDWLEAMSSDERTVQILVQARRQLDNAPEEVLASTRTAAAGVIERLGQTDAPMAGGTGLGLERGLPGQMADALAILMCVPSLLDYHRAHHVPEAVSWATLSDLPRKVSNYRDRHEGVDGLDDFWWLANHLRGLLYELGRLQFIRCRPDIGIGLAEGEFFLDTHIPATGPMDRVSCDESFRRAVDEIPRWFPKERYVGFTCFSWLLDPQLAEYLDPETNIMKFQRRFRPVPDFAFPDGGTTIGFVFGKPGDVDLDTLPQRSTLERAIVNHIRNGGEWRICGGWFPADAVPKPE